MVGGIGLFEIIVIGGVALIVLGPEKFPGFIKTSARVFRDMRKYINEAQREIAKEIKPLQNDLDELNKIDPKNYLENLIGEDEEDDGTINPEPEPDFDDLYPGGEIHRAPEDTVGYGSETYDPEAPNGSEETVQETAGDEGDGQPDLQPETPERLDG